MRAPGALRSALAPRVTLTLALLLALGLPPGLTDCASAPAPLRGNGVAQAIDDQPDCRPGDRVVVSDGRVSLAR